MDATNVMTSQTKTQIWLDKRVNYLGRRSPITWRDALETVINSRKLSDALGNPSTQRKCFYCPICQITLYIIRQEQHNALLKNKRKETYTVSQKGDAKIQIPITTAYLIRIKYPLSSFNYHLFDVKVANFNKIHLTVSEQQLF